MPQKGSKMAGAAPLEPTFNDLIIIATACSCLRHHHTKWVRKERNAKNGDKTKLL